MLYVREWAVNHLSCATPDPTEASFLTQPSQAVDWASELGRLDLPTLLVREELDPLVDIREFENLNSRLPDSKLVVFERSGHPPALARPRDVAAEINTFFRP